MRAIVAPYGRREPAAPAEVASLLSAMPCRWWIAGGYAIELAVGHRVREHGGIDVMMPRPDQLHLHGTLRADRPGRHPIDALSRAHDTHPWQEQLAR
jgi:hypothetical protein